MHHLLLQHCAPHQCKGFVVFADERHHARRHVVAGSPWAIEQTTLKHGRAVNVLAPRLDELSSVRQHVERWHDSVMTCTSTRTYSVTHAGVTGSGGLANWFASSASSHRMEGRVARHNRRLPRGQKSRLGIVEQNQAGHRTAPWLVCTHKPVSHPSDRISRVRMSKREDGVPCVNHSPDDHSLLLLVNPVEVNRRTYQ